MSPPRPTIGVVIPTRDSLRWIDACLESVLVQQEVELRVIVVDNASSDGLGEHVRRRWPGVEVLDLQRNVGYGGAVNEGARALGGGHVLGLNVDTVLDPGCLCALARALDAHPGAGVAAPRARNPDGTPQPSAHRFPTLPRLAAEAIGLDRLPLLGRRAAYHLPDVTGGPAIVDWATGIALLVREQAWRESGGFDPAYFFFVEEIDLQWRLAARGWSTVIEPAASLVHHGGKRPLGAGLFAASHDGMERWFARRMGGRAGLLARAILCLTAATRAVAWGATALLWPRRRSEARRWARMFAGVFAVSAGRLGAGLMAALSRSARR